MPQSVLSSPVSPQDSKKKSQFTPAVDIFLICLISLNILAIILESVASLHNRYGPVFFYFELFSIMVFTIEYLVRAWRSVELKNPQFYHPVRGRLRYLLTPMALIDLIAILPFYLTLFIQIDLRMLRVFRLFRVFKLTRYSSAMTLILAVFKEESRSFFAAFFVLFILLILASTGIYLIEHEVQPDAFGTIPDSMWWALVTLTTVGYGDVIPITTPGKLFGGCITIIGIGMVALPAGILASGFSDQLHRRRQKYHLMLEDAFADGIISGEEKDALQHLRKHLGVNEEDARVLFEIASRSQGRTLTHCPHCKALLAHKRFDDPETL